MSSEAVECVIRKVRIKQGKLGPVLVKFEHGCMNTDKAKNLNCGIYSDKNTQIVAAVPDESDIIYRGILDQRENDLCHTVVAVKKKNTNKVYLYEADSVVLSPFINRIHQDVVLSTPDERNATSNLNRIFGSKKSKRMADRIDKMTANMESVKDQMPAMVTDIKVEDSSLQSIKDNSFDKLLPICNRLALTIGEAYPIHGILSDSELKSLKEAASNMSEGSIATPKMSPFCEHLAINLKNDSVKNLGLLLYVQSLIDLCCVKTKNILSRKESICSYSDSVWSRLLREFTCGPERSVTSTMEDKAIIHIIILGLHIGNNVCNLDLLSKSLKFRGLTASRIKMLAGIVGAVKTTSTDYVTLKFPLPPMRVLSGRGRKGK